MQQEEGSFHQQINLRKRPVKCYVWKIDLRGAEIWTLRKVDWKYLGIF